MGLHHSNSINQVEGMQVVAVCDVDKKRTAQAEQDLPGIVAYNDVKDLLKDDGVDLCVVILPHNLHAKIAIECSRAGKHVVVEKPMCVTTKEATAMIEAAKKADKVLTVFHNRRHDGDFKALRDAVRSGIIGDVFHVEMFMGNHSRPGDWWRSDKEISGGAFFDWGAHCLDWLLHIIDQKLDYVTGHFHKLVWDHVTNEDQVEASIRFQGGAVANIQYRRRRQAPLARVGHPRRHRRRRGAVHPPQLRGRDPGAGRHQVRRIRLACLLSRSRRPPPARRRAGRQARAGPTRDRHHGLRGEVTPDRQDGEGTV